MATSARVLTLQDVNSVEPVLRLRLTDTANILAAQRPSHPGFLERAKDFATKMFSRAEAELELETGATKEATERNKRKVDQLFDSMIKKVNKQREEVKRDLEGLTPQQQEDVITFWTAVQEFFADVFKWLQDVFAMVIDKIRNGFRVVKEAVKGVFDAVMGYLKLIF